jgi:glycosyltransferase involved in cell wall biosynthesis
MPEKVPITILMPVLNEADKIGRALDSVAWADEIVVIDSQSTDGTGEIAEKHGAKVVQFHWNGTWPKKRNWALDHVPFKHPWLFILDADEVLPPEAEQEFREIVTAPMGGIAGYWINRRFMFMGKWLEHAYYPNWNMRFLRHELCRYEKLTGSPNRSGDNEVHELVIVKGETGKLRCQMDHYAFPTVDVFVEKHNRYSNWEAWVALEHAAGPPTGERAHKPLRRRVKEWSLRLPFRPLLRFLYVYLVQGGIFDGPEGYYFARLHGFYEFLSVAKTYELRKKQREEKSHEPSGNAGS